MAVTFETLLRDLGNKVYKPVYFLHGDEPYFIDAVSDFIEANVLTGMEKEFNQTVLYGRETDVLSLIGLAKRYPMMANYQVVIVKEAQDIGGLVPRANSKEESALIPYLEKPQPSTLLVLCYKHKSLDKRTKLAKVLAKQAVWFESARLKDPKVPGWIEAYVKGKGRALAGDAARLLAECTGNDLQRIVHELDKLFLHVGQGGRIDTGLIEKYIGISKEFNVFELQKALGARNAAQALRIANYMSANEKNNPMALTLGSLGSYFNKVMTYHYLSDKSSASASAALGVSPFFLHEYVQAARNYKPARIAEIFSLLRTADLHAKGVDNESAGTADLTRELVYKILH
jgi:DNA polymerase-3 subunit delta